MAPTTDKTVKPSPTKMIRPAVIALGLMGVYAGIKQAPAAIAAHSAHPVASSPAAADAQQMLRAALNRSPQSTTRNVSTRQLAFRS